MMKYSNLCLRTRLNHRINSKKQSLSDQKTSFNLKTCLSLHQFRTTRSFWFSTEKINQFQKEQPNIFKQNQKGNHQIDGQQAELLKIKNYSFRILTKQYKQQAVELIAREFRAHEPLLNAFFRKYPESEQNESLILKDLWGKWMDHSCKNSMSVAVHDTNSNNQLIGVFAAKDFFYEPPNFAEKYLQNKNLNIFGSVFQILMKLVQKADPLVRVEINQAHNVADLWGAAISNKHAGKNLLSEMIKLNEQLAKKEGYKYAFCFATNFKTQKGLRRLNYQMISKGNAKQTKYLDALPFEYIEEEQNYPSIWLKQI